MRIRVSKRGFSRLGPPRVVTCPERPEGAIHGLAEPDFVELEIRAVAGLVLSGDIGLCPAPRETAAVGGQVAASSVGFFGMGDLPWVGGRLRKPCGANILPVFSVCKSFAAVCLRRRPFSMFQLKGARELACAVLAHCQRQQRVPVPARPLARGRG